MAHLSDRDRDILRDIQINLIIICNLHEFETTLLYDYILVFYIAQIHLPICNGLSHFVTRSLCDCQMELDFHTLYPADVVYAILHFHPAHNGQNLIHRETRTNTCTMCKVFRSVMTNVYTFNRRAFLSILFKCIRQRGIVSYIYRRAQAANTRQ